MRELTKKQRMFCIAYLEGKNVTNCAKIAGYSEKSAKTIGHKLLRSKSIQEYLTSNSCVPVETVRNKDIIMKKEEVLIKLTAIARGEIKNEEVIIEAKGFGVSEHLKIETIPSIRDRIKALELIAKILGMFTISNESIGTIKIINDIPK